MSAAAGLRPRRFRSRDEAELAVVEWIGWYNHHRLHSALDDHAPAEYETMINRGHHPNDRNQMNEPLRNPVRLTPGGPDPIRCLAVA